MGSITNRISKAQFDAAYNKHLPNGWIKFAFKYFSNSTEAQNMSLKNNIAYSLLGLFLIAFFGTVFHAPKAFIEVFISIYSILLVALALYLFSAIFLNNHRITLICKELGITKDEYNVLVSAYYN